MKRGHLAQLPVYLPDLSSNVYKVHHDRIVELVERMLSLYKRLVEAKIPQDQRVIQQQIAITDQQIDKLVYELYGLTEEEIKIVEEKQGGQN